jgi:hypothetical protein
VSRSIQFDPAARLEAIEAAVWYDVNESDSAKSSSTQSNSPSVAEFRAHLLPTSKMFDVFQ